MKNKYIYLDNAATSFPKPPTVIKAVSSFMRNEAANPGRGSHRLSLLASERIYSVRESIATLLGVSNPERVVFTSGATAALNLAIKTGVTRGAHVLISDIEHNSVLRAVYAMSLTHGVSYSVFDTDNIEQSIKRLINDRTTHVISTLASNVDGRHVSIELLSRVAKENGLKLILDATQLLGHVPLDLRGIEYDVLCSAGHKALFGLPGVGFCVFGSDGDRPTFMEGGSGSSSKELTMPQLLPERYEAGTLPTASIVSLGAGIGYIENVGIENIRAHLDTLTVDLKERISATRGVDLCRGYLGTVMLTSKELTSEELAARLDGLGFAVRGGFHCAPLAHKKFGTYQHGACRVSLSYLNTKKHIELFERALWQALKV